MRSIITDVLNMWLHVFESMSITEDNPTCEMCDSNITHATYDSKTHDWDMSCLDCGFRSSDRNGTHEMSLVTTRHCRNCAVGITSWSVAPEGYRHNCYICEHSEIQPSIELFESVTPEERWDFLKDYHTNPKTTDYTYSWRPCEGGCEDYWYDSMTDAATSCESCIQLTKKSKIWKDWN